MAVAHTGRSTRQQILDSPAMLIDGSRPVQNPGRNLDGVFQRHDVLRVTGDAQTGGQHFGGVTLDAKAVCEQTMQVVDGYWHDKQHHYEGNDPEDVNGTRNIKHDFIPPVVSRQSPSRPGAHPRHQVRPRWLPSSY